MRYCRLDQVRGNRGRVRRILSLRTITPLKSTIRSSENIIVVGSPSSFEPRPSHRGIRIRLCGETKPTSRAPHPQSQSTAKRQYSLQTEYGMHIWSAKHGSCGMPIACHGTPALYLAIPTPTCQGPHICPPHPKLVSNSLSSSYRPDLDRRCVHRPLTATKHPLDNDMARAGKRRSRLPRLVDAIRYTSPRQPNQSGHGKEMIPRKP